LNRKFAIALGILLFVIFLGVLTWLMVGNRKNRVEVCMAYQGRTACKTASGATREDAIRTATDSACALIAAGMSETRACSTAAPLSVRNLD
jgi:hypothetical protein